MAGLAEEATPRQRQRAQRDPVVLLHRDREASVVVSAAVLEEEVASEVVFEATAATAEGVVLATRAVAVVLAVQMASVVNHHQTHPQVPVEGGVVDTVGMAKTVIATTNVGMTTEDIVAAVTTVVPPGATGSQFGHEIRMVIATVNAIETAAEIGVGTGAIVIVNANVTDTAVATTTTREKDTTMVTITMTLGASADIKQNASQAY